MAGGAAGAGGAGASRGQQRAGGGFDLTFPVEVADGRRLQLQWNRGAQAPLPPRSGVSVWNGRWLLHVGACWRRSDASGNDVCDAARALPMVLHVGKWLWLPS